MGITYHSLNRSYLDQNEFAALMKDYEGYVSVAYDDGRHIATIGIGVNLKERNYLARVLQELGVFTASDIAESTRRAAAHLAAETATERKKN